MKNFKLHLFLVFFICLALRLQADDGYRLWLRYDQISDPEILENYQANLRTIAFLGEGEIFKTAENELLKGLNGLLTQKTQTVSTQTEADIIVGSIGEDFSFLSTVADENPDNKKEEAFIIEGFEGKTYILGTDERGVLYGVFHFLRHLQLQKPIEDIRISQAPKLKLRMLNHWDNLDGTVERGYAGFSIWNWHQLPEFIDKRYIEYARANASIGINATAVTNVNANSLIFREDYLEKAAALADVFRPYGIKLFLTARFSSPIELGKLATADPMDPKVQQWWKEKTAELYEKIPDFGGFLVKANSEGQPGPQEYGRTHAEGANLLADALAPFGGVVIWRAFVYSEEEPVDRAKQAYDEFMALDGQFRENVMVQVKNGPIDFQPREPIHPLFGAMRKTPVMMEFQVTKEYLGQGTHLVGLSNMYEEILQTDTYQFGENSTVAKVLDGSLTNQKLTGMAGVSNIGTSRNWTGNLFAQADWFAYGKMAWNPNSKSDDIFEEWAKLTFGHEEQVVQTVSSLLDRSYEACVKYMTPIGLHHIMGPGHHFGPGPWVSEMSRADWTSVYYHKADSEGLGFDRTVTGSNALEQYHPMLAAKYENMETCPLPFLLWFHHVPWDHELSTGNSLWMQLVREYYEGAEIVSHMKEDWENLQGMVDEERFEHVLMHLEIQEKEAKWWRDACLLYFQQFSKMEIPADWEQPEHDLDYYESLTFPYSPGIRPRW
ncbi:alpha-glucuronidase family glycosyl hydrolase [Algoriphagus sediminis]|uniref:Xylan alpha-1,2-glucuronidase n=1 Tax=Algoriphagus sediminis TaxID=3057113 RepID=A0ABT7YCR2_9BACT|nr:alpha-glucuronidase family glycosyl hydrolase [Algoriphagus sediminis]MDN3204303.1 alpha-glucuronidase family glycosyl hydrolase [Algoriphagus sediminis]